MSSTRVLILGCLLDGPMSGYGVRRRLEVMGADGWASVAFGSIYHGLGKMADEGLLEVVESGRGGKTVYALTEAGRQEFHRLLLISWHEVKPVVDPFQVAVTFIDKLSKQEILDGLHARAARLRTNVETIGHIFGVKHHYGAPRHVNENLRLTQAMYQAQLDWVENAIPRVEADELP
ncbi:PadR family transcriptional regulator [Nonomuraea pusilla]|uniref:DNA-binding transcriptional regulator, PadR family n=1 Tax=Nonomuraea pusilla TaxID=46177 RepID=A0A1H7W7P1_9ACTN|nr:PadR family transcriptional regulator [Nonomuraea pusilla]SEM17612.1 DNA-binding transcriptional regulator, PadR family [Nonomuraea pusilla]